MKNIDEIKGYYIYKSIFLPNNNYVLQLKKDLSNEEADIIVIFKDCLMVDDIRLSNTLIEDIANESSVGLKYSFIIQSVNENPKNYNQLIIFDKEKEEAMDTGKIKKPIMNIIYKHFILSYDIYSYKGQINKVV